MIGSRQWASEAPARVLVSRDIGSRLSPTRVVLLWMANSKKETPLQVDRCLWVQSLFPIVVAVDDLMDYREDESG